MSDPKTTNSPIRMILENQIMIMRSLYTESTSQSIANDLKDHIEKTRKIIEETDNA